MHHKIKKVKQDIGLALLGTSATFGAWSAWNSSYFTIASFADTPEKIQKTREAMALGMASSAVLAGGLYAVYNKKATFASLATLFTGVALYGIYEWQLREREKQLGIRQ